MLMRSSQRRSHPTVASYLLPGLAFYRTVIRLVSHRTAVQAKALGPPPFLLLPGKPSSPDLHGLVIVDGADRVPAAGPLTLSSSQ